MTTVLLLAGLAIIALVVLKLKKKDKLQPTPTPIIRGWTPAYSTGVSSNGSSINLPKGEASHLHYAQHTPAPLLVQGGLLRVRMSVVGGKFFPKERPDEKALATLVVFGKDGSRWYSRKSWLLIDGETVLEETLSADKFGGVMGETDAVGFNKAMESPDCIAVAFGQEAGRGHGVCSATDSVFTLRLM